MKAEKVGSRFGQLQECKVTAGIDFIAHQYLTYGGSSLVANR